jgi:hypothetical protein
LKSHHFSKANHVCEDKVKVRQVAKTLIQVINIQTEEHDMFDGLVWVSTGAVRCYVRDSLLGKEHIELRFVGIDTLDMLDLFPQVGQLQAQAS